jgi:hypothetical protein
MSFQWNYLLAQVLHFNYVKIDRFLLVQLSGEFNFK